jgi:hypothetical protein
VPYISNIHQLKVGVAQGSLSPLFGSSPQQTWRRTSIRIASADRGNLDLLDAKGRAGPIYRLTNLRDQAKPLFNKVGFDCEFLPIVRPTRPRQMKGTGLWRASHAKIHLGKRGG